jgi:RimJ/RimL family protein N-acetyltransferase
MVISKLGFTYKGRLIQNSQIAGEFEDMNIWVKEI